MTSTAYLALGANLGDAAGMLRAAMAAVGGLPGTQVLARSSLYRTGPVDSTGPDYVNAVMAISTALPPLALLAALQQLENSAGRQRPHLNAPRTLDLDILLYGDVAINTPVLTLPHPRMQQRAFVLVPLAEIAPQQVPAAWLLAVSSQAVQPF